MFCVEMFGKISDSATSQSIQFRLRRKIRKIDISRIGYDGIYKTVPMPTGLIGKIITDWTDTVEPTGLIIRV